MTGSPSPPRSREIQHLLRDLTPEVLGVLVRRHRDFGAAEDAVQEALTAAALQWPTEGIPEHPRAWLIHVARRRFTDHVRAESARRRRETEVVLAALPEERIAPSPDSDVVLEQDDTLLLLFMCCHPSLTRSSAIALTLRAVGGLTTGEIARAFLVPEATMAQRISRAKQSIGGAGARFEMPTPEERDDRLDAVLHVLYLIFNEGYASSSGPTLQRVDLSNEAIRLARGLHRVLPDEPEVAGLLALLLLTDARRAARADADGEIVPLDEQDRSLWDRAFIDEGTALLTGAMSRGAVGPYQLQAAIAALHDEAPSTEATDWAQIRMLYGLLRRLGDNPMVALSEAVAAAMVEGPSKGLALVAPLDHDPRIADHFRLDAVRGHFYEMSGDRSRAVTHYRRAASKTTSTPERNYLLMKAAKLHAGEA